MVDTYLPLLVIFLVSAFIGLLIIVLSTALSLRRNTDVKLMPYECGMDPIGDARRRFSVRFFLIGMLFIVFDIELIFLFPWATIYRDLMKLTSGCLPVSRCYGLAILRLRHFLLAKTDGTTH